MILYFFTIIMVMIVVMSMLSFWRPVRVNVHRAIVVSHSDSVQMACSPFVGRFLDISYRSFRVSYMTYFVMIFN